MTKTVTCKALFGLGITSSNTVYAKLNKVASLDPVEFVSLGSVLKAPKAKVVIFDSLKTMITNMKNIRENHVVVLSDAPVFLQAFPSLIPLDFDNPRSFEFRFLEPDLKQITAAVKRKKSIEFQFVQMDHLGYYVDNFKQDDDTIQRFIRLMLGLPFNTRERIREAVFGFLTGRVKFKQVQETLTTYVPENMSDLSYQFLELFKTQAKDYRDAIESEKPPKVAAKQFGVDEYGISFFRKMIRNQKFVELKREAS